MEKNRRISTPAFVNMKRLKETLIKGTLLK